MDKVFKVQGSLKNYEWGKIGINSTVAQLQKSAFSNFVVQEIPYAELWMGTHISGPTKIPSLQDMKLIDWIQNHPDCLGNGITDSFGASNGLPFLFKVLSVNKALSIQVHPDKVHAENLHKEFPEHYPDDNHKPEMAIAFTEFEALCGFRPLHEIKEFFISIPHLKNIVTEVTFNRFINSPSENNLRSLFTELMTCSVDSFQLHLINIVQDFQRGIFENELCQSISRLFLNLSFVYPADIGLFCLFFLNYLKLKPGEAIFLAANEPHAYLSGDCIECMACSDNVVRAGLTPKFKDVTTLCNMLSYKCKSAEENIFPYITDPENPFLKIYNPPVNEFVIDVMDLSTRCKTYSIRKTSSASILLIMSGTGHYKSNNHKDTLNTGDILFISSNEIIDIEPQNDMKIFRAHCSK